MCLRIKNATKTKIRIIRKTVTSNLSFIILREDIIRVSFILWNGVSLIRFAKD